MRRGQKLRRLFLSPNIGKNAERTSSVTGKNDIEQKRTNKFEGGVAMELTRRAMLGALGGLAVGGTVASVVGTSIAADPKTKRFEQINGDFGWKPHKLDPKECAAVAYDGYWHKGLGCAYGAFYAIVGLMGEKYGAPYNQFPFAMLEVGKGGISDWGTICGALLGPASAYALFWGRKERNAMVSELYRWYETAKLPIFNPGEAAKGVKGDLPTSVADSVLCHVSLSRWCFENKVEANSKARSERCGRLTADVTYKAVEIMNAKIDGTFKPALAAPQSVTTCGECHAKGKEADNMKSVMDCTPCHSGNEHLMNKFKDHP